MKFQIVYVEYLTNMPINTHYFIPPNNDFTDFVYELQGQPSFTVDTALVYQIFFKATSTTDRLFKQQKLHSPFLPP